MYVIVVFKIYKHVIIYKLYNTSISSIAPRQIAGYIIFVFGEPRPSVVQSRGNS